MKVRGNLWHSGFSVIAWADGELGTALSISVRGVESVIAAGMPGFGTLGVGRVGMYRVTSREDGAPPICSLIVRIAGFRQGLERDTGSAVSFDDEVAFFGSPTASNAMLASPGVPGRLYVKSKYSRLRVPSE